MNWTRFSGRNLTVVYVSALVILTVSATFCLYSFRDAVDSGRRVENTYGNIIELESAFADINAVESAARGYVLNGEPEALRQYQSYKSLVLADEERFSEATRASREERDNLDNLRRLVNAKISLMDRYAKMRATGPLTLHQTTAQSSFGRNLMTEIRHQVDSMEAYEKRLLTRRQNATYRNSALGFVFFGLSTVSGLLLLTGVFSLSQRLIRTFNESRARQQAYSDRLEEEIEHTRVVRLELERSNRELQDFAFVASHDLQEPLRKIRAYADRIRNRVGKDLDPTSNTDLSRVQSAAERMQGLINDVLALSRVSTKAQPFVSVDLNTIFDEVVDDLETRIQQSNAMVSRGELPTIEGDAVQMRQLLQNLIGNALKFMKPGVLPKVTVLPDSRAGKGKVGFSVADNGIGFDERHAEKIFTVFQRLHSRTEYEGTGVGLAICRRIVERHGGTIVANGVPGEGAAFIVSLPKKQPNRNNH